MSYDNMSRTPCPVSPDCSESMLRPPPWADEIEIPEDPAPAPPGLPPPHGLLLRSAPYDRACNPAYAKPVSQGDTWLYDPVADKHIYAGSVKKRQDSIAQSNHARRPYDPRTSTKPVSHGDTWLYDPVADTYINAKSVKKRQDSIAQSNHFLKEPLHKYDETPAPDPMYKTEALRPYDPRTPIFAERLPHEYVPGEFSNAPYPYDQSNSGRQYSAPTHGDQSTPFVFRRRA